MGDSGTSQRHAWLIAIAWSLLAIIAASLLSLAVFLLFRMELFSGKPLTNEHIKSLWAFLGVALGAVGTLIGALLTEQNNRRAHTLAREAGDRAALALKQQENQSRETENRLTLDTRAKVLELIAHDAEYAPSAKIAGAIATMMELRGGPVATRVLDELWSSGKVSTTAAVWLLDQVLLNPRSSESDQVAAATTLTANAGKLFPARDSPNQEVYEWPELLAERWPHSAPSRVRNSLLVVVVKALLSREPDFWRGGNTLPTDTLYRALDDEEYNSLAAWTLAKLIDVEFISFEADDESRIRSLASGADASQWFADLVSQFDSWASGDEPALTRDDHRTPSAMVTAEEVPATVAK